MRRAHYPLQAMLYLVALHRYLRWRMPGYDPAANLGGAFYLFLRGMACPGVSTVEGGAVGAFAWGPPTAAGDWAFRSSSGALESDGIGQ